MPEPPAVPSAPFVDALVELFEGLPHVMFSAKGPDGRYLAVNQAFADRAGRKTPASVTGRSAAELFEASLARSYDAQDAALLTTGRPIRRHLELITRPDGTLGWYVTNKSLACHPTGIPLAVLAVSVDQRSPVDHAAMPGLERALSYAREHFSGPLAPADLAGAAGTSVALLERRMRRMLGISPRQLIVRTRVEEAVHRLVRGDSPLSEVAAACGFFDQAAMTRQVKALLGVTPGALREHSRAMGF